MQNVGEKRQLCRQWSSDSNNFKDAAFVAEYIKAMMKKV
jgi:hypothetical protein